MDKNLAVIIIVLGTSVVLPILLVFFNMRRKMDSEKNKKEIILAALEKNAEIDIESLVRKMNVPDKLLKEKLLNRLQWGLLTTILGIGLSATAAWMGYVGGSSPDHIYLCGWSGAALIAVGVVFLITYHVGRKMLAKEMEAEEQNLRLTKKS